MLYLIDSKKKGHYESYKYFLESIIGKKKVCVIQNKLSNILKYKKGSILFLDFTLSNVLFIILASFKFKVFLLSVSVEELYLNEKKGVKKFLNRAKLFEFLKYFNFLNIISTHRGASYENKLICVKHFIYDIQYYDLLICNYESEEPIETKKLSPKKSILFFLNTSTKKYDIKSLSNSIKLNKEINFIIISRTVDFSSYKNVVQINRYIDDKELVALYKKYNWILSTTNTYRPSGIFGRAMQFNKFAIILENSYNSEIGYINSIEIKNYDDLGKINFNSKPKFFDTNFFNDSKKLKQILINE